MADRFCNIFIKKKSPWSIALDVVLNVVLVLLIAVFCLVSTLKTIGISGRSMYPTLNDGDQVAISRIDKSYERGDIVVAQKDDYYIIKRVIAVEGDTIAFAWDSGVVKLFIDDMTTPVDEPYIKEAMVMVDNSGKGLFIKPAQTLEELRQNPDKYAYTIPENHLFLMGDNRNHSTDSRVDGTYDESSVIGKMVFNVTESKVLSFIFDIIQRNNKEITKHD